MFMFLLGKQKAHWMLLVRAPLLPPFQSQTVPTDCYVEDRSCLRSPVYVLHRDRLPHMVSSSEFEIALR
jgi:hypothetical protein